MRPWKLKNQHISWPCKDVLSVAVFQCGALRWTLDSLQCLPSHPRHYLPDLLSLQLMVGWSADGSPWSHPGGERGLQEGHQPQEDEPGSGSLQGWPGQALRPQLCPQGITVADPSSESANNTVISCVTQAHRDVPHAIRLRVQSSHHWVLILN